MLFTRRSFLIITGAIVGSPVSAQDAYQSPWESMGVPEPRRRPAPQCSDRGETRLGYPGFQHCRLHPHYQIAFAKWGCHCYTGQCRPTMFRYARIDTKDADGKETYIAGLEIFASGKYHRIPLAAYRTEKADMSPELLEYSAHVCCDDPADGSEPHIECAWIDLGS